MNELAFLTQLKDEPVALAAAGAIVLYKVAGELGKHVLPFITKRKKKTVEETLAEDTRDRKVWRAGIETKLGEIEKLIEKVFTILDDHEKATAKISQGTLENTLFNENLSAFRRLKSFLRLTAMRANGPVKEYGFKLISQHKEVWHNVIDAHIALKIVDQKYFNEVLEEIDKRITCL